MAGPGPNRPGFRRASARARGALRRLRLLLDTHVALWWLNDPARLAAEAREAIADEANDVYLSAASVWEVELKVAAGKLVIPTPILDAADAARLAELPIRSRHVARAARLPPLHADPFDRVLVAQALDEDLVLATRDRRVRQYAVSTMPA